MFATRLILASLLPLVCGAAAAQEAGSAPAAGQKDACLACHGPLEKLAGADVRFKVDGGTVNPHRFVPHDSKDAADFPECTVCHQVHPMPPAKGYKDAKANVEVCYQCHHNYTFEPCSKCHN